jgi:hypothetical protein
MTKASSEIFLDGKSVEFTQASLKERGGNTAAELNFIIPLGDSNYRKYWNKEVTVFFQEGDGLPIFRGRVINNVINNNNSIKIRALDALGLLTGNQRARVVLDHYNNIDGLSAGASIVKLIKMANLQDVVGTDFIGDTSPVIMNDNPRGIVVILEEILSYITEAVNLSNEELPLQNVIIVRDDGTKAQLRLETEADIETATPVKFYSYDKNMISFGAKEKHLPTTIIVQGKNSSATFTHNSAVTAYGDHFLEVTNKKLKSKAECFNFAQKIFRANTLAKYEYTLNTFEGVYLKENDVIFITDDETGINGNFRVVGKTISFGPNSFRLRLYINKRPPLLSEFFRTTS